MRKLLAIFSIVLVALGISACAPDNDVELEDLHGRWVTTDEEGYEFTAYFVEDDFEVHIVLPDGSNGIYWRGTVEIPENPGQEFSWVSQGDKALLDTSLFGSNLEEKEFVYDNGKLQFEFTILGTVQTISLEKRDIDE